MENGIEIMVQKKVRAVVNETQTNLKGAFDQLMSSKLDSMQHKTNMYKSVDSLEVRI